MPILLKGFEDDDLISGLMMIKSYKKKFLTTERMGLRKGVIYTSAALTGHVYVYHTKTQIVAVHST